MKKILLSLGIIAVVAIVAVNATGAFFSDTETSTGNTFTAGAIDLKVDSQQHYNNMVCTGSDSAVPVYTWQPEANFTPPVGHYPALGSPCDGTWLETDLGVQKFFNFTDVKPGDNGENTISLHVINNDAYACIDVNITKNDDVSSTEPELVVDVANTDSIFDGELAQNVYFTSWRDDGDNIWENGEPLLFTNQSGPASDVLGGKTYALADSTTAPLAAGDTSFIGLAWCMGTQTVNTGNNTITCNGATMGNNTQTDSMQASIAFRVEQSRNNSNFICAPVVQTDPTQHSLRLENEVVVEDGPWTVLSGDQVYADLTWTDGPTFAYTLNGIGLTPNTQYSLIYYADGWPGNNPGAFIATHTTDASGNIVGSGSPELNMDLPTMPDGNFAVGAKIWLVRTSDYNSGNLSTGPMTAWNPGQYLFEGNVYSNYNDTQI